MRSSLKYNLAIRLGKIKNITMKQRTCFQIRLTVYVQDQLNQNIVASPYECLSLGQNYKSDTNVRAGQIMTDYYMSPKILVNGTAEGTNIDAICIFKGAIPIKDKPSKQPTIFVFAQLFWVASKQPELVGEWTGHTNTSCLSSQMDIYFSNHFSTCSISASIHCLTDEINIQNENLFQEIDKNRQYYNYTFEKMTTLYHACLDPLIFSLDSLKKWNRAFRKMSNIKEDLPSPKDKSDWKYFRLRRLLEVSGPSKQKQKDKINFMEFQEDLDTKQYLECIKADSYRISEYIFVCWKDILSLMRISPQSEYFQQLQTQYRMSREKNNWLNHYTITDDPQSKKQQIVPILQKSIDALLFQPHQQHQSQIRFSLNDLKIIATQVSKENQHILILVHGFQASSYDMELIGAYFQFLNPNLHVIISQANQGRTQAPIEECAHRLALEVKNYINTRTLKDVYISFLGHSMGGLIIRAALKYLQLYKANFCLYISLCSPHLGYLYHTSKIVTTSMWVMNMVKKDQSMIELTMADNKNLTKTYLYELAECSELAWFDKVVLLGSREDEYVPFDSSLLLGRDFFYETSSAKIHQQMYQNLVSKIEDKIIRFQIVYKDKVKDLSGFIGRTAHIKALSYLPIIQLYVTLISKLF